MTTRPFRSFPAFAPWRVLAALGLLLGALAAVAAPPAGAQAGESFSLATVECRRDLALDGSSLADRSCAGRRDRAFDLVDPEGGSAALTTTALYPDLPDFRATFWSPDVAADRGQAGTWELREVDRDEEAADLVRCLRNDGAERAPAAVRYLEPGVVGFEWDPAVYDGGLQIGDGQTLACTWYAVPPTPAPAPGLLTISTAIQDAPDLVAVEPEGEPAAFGATVPGQVPAATFTLRDEETGEETTLETAGGNADDVFPLRPGDYALTADATGEEVGFALDEGQSVLALAGIPAETAPPPAGEAPATTGVVGVALACPSADADRDACEDLAGVTIAVEADGVPVAGSPFTSEMNSIGSNSIEFDAAPDATLTLTQVDGVPEGYAPAPGYDPLTVNVADLEERGTGGESTSPYVDIINVPVVGDDAPLPVGTAPPQIDAEQRIAFAAIDWQGALSDLDDGIYGREAVAVYGAQSPYPAATLTFGLDEAGDGQTALTLTGLDDELPGPTPVAISVNGEVVYEGEAGFYDFDPAAPEVAWQRWTLYFPSNLLRPGENAIAVAQLAPSANVGEPPYVLLAEAFVAIDVSGVGAAPVRAIG